MYTKATKEYFATSIEDIKNKNLYKEERLITGPQSAQLAVADRDEEVINLCSNDYLGLAGDAQTMAYAIETIKQYGYGLSSVRFICGTQSIHKELEKDISNMLGVEDSILYSSCFDANVGVLGSIMAETDAIISDELNHASIIDGIRLSKAKRFRYKNNNMADLEKTLREASRARIKLIVTDGVFSMEGTLANLPEICNLAEQYGALVMVDDSHAVGIFGANGAGCAEYYNVKERVDIYTGTLGKALGGASGGYVSGPELIIKYLRQNSRPYLFSNSLSPVIAGTSVKLLHNTQLLASRRKKLWHNTDYFKKIIATGGLDVIVGNSPIVPVIIGDAENAMKVASELYKNNVYVTAFSYPVVPVGKARIRIQISAAHSEEMLAYAAKHLIEAVRKNSN